MSVTSKSSGAVAFERFPAVRDPAMPVHQGLYDPKNETFFPELMTAHKALDAAVEAAYGVDFGGDEEKIVAHLFNLYAKKVGEL